MAQAEPKMVPTGASVDAFLDAVMPAVRRADGHALRTLIAERSGEPAAMWGPSIVGFGSCRYRHDSGRSGAMPRIGFSPRKAELVLYLAHGFSGHAELLARLGPHRTGAACLYVKALDRIDRDVLTDLIDRSLAVTAERYPADAESR